jgi:pimeloyl-ACP methyl ester carboxylesterase
VSRIDAVVEAPGPWTHRQVAANGARFHVAELGTGPLVLFLHGFPEFWWAWRHQLPVVAAAGYRAAAMDLRGYGGSDKTPRGYDPMTLAADVAGVIRCLGARDAVVVGHGWGGFVGWATAAMQPSVVRALAAVCAPHPLQMARLFTSDRRHLGTVGQLLAMQVPMMPERRITAADCAFVEQHLRRASAPGSTFPDAEAGSATGRDAALAGSPLRARVPPLAGPLEAALGRSVLHRAHACARRGAGVDGRRRAGRHRPVRRCRRRGLRDRPVPR